MDARRKANRKMGQYREEKVRNTRNAGRKRNREEKEENKGKALEEKKVEGEATLGEEQGDQEKEIAIKERLITLLRHQKRKYNLQGVRRGYVKISEALETPPMKKAEEQTKMIKGMIEKTETFLSWKHGRRRNTYV